MENLNLIQPETPKTRALPAPQSYLLLAILIGYPLLSIAMNLAGPASPAHVTSRINQIYLPSLFIQCLMLMIVWVVLGRTNTNFGEIGLGKKDINMSNVVAGIIFFMGAAMLIVIIKTAIEKSGYLPEKDIFYLLPITIPEKAIWILLSIGAAFAEEITFRGYAISRLKIISGNYWIGVVLSSMAFSLGHLYQGFAGVILTFVYGLLFAGLYVARRSIFPCIVAHFLQDAMILLVFKGTG
jgi:membrane protease YdiL (CAAX protease family)